MSAFDPQEFLNSPQSSGFDTRFAIHKAGDWVGMIGTGDKDIAVRAVQVTDKTTGVQSEHQVMEVALYTDDPAAVGEGGTAPARCRYTCWLDFTPDGKTLDFGPGKNRQLGYLLTATGFQDKKGTTLKPWSPALLKGQRVKYRVAHSPRKDTGELQADVSQVASPV